MIRRIAAVALCLFTGCQDYEFIFVPDSLYKGVRLNFAVQQPSKADILFVVDNSLSMTEEQDALKASIDELLAALAPKDTSYRIGIVSTDARGWWEGCNNQPLSADILPTWRPVSRGNCQDPNVVLRYPHDGARGRLIAAYDPVQFDLDDPLNPAAQVLTADQRNAFALLAPTGVASGPEWRDGEVGARTVIDRDVVQAEACIACGCVGADATSDDIADSCGDDDACFNDCANPVATELVKAFFRSNVNGLGINGAFYEEGLLTSLYAVGVDPGEAIDAEDPDDPGDDNLFTAINPDYNLTKEGQPNSYLVRDELGVIAEQPWLREEALLAIMYVSDEQDCSMPDYLYGEAFRYEEPARPVGSFCYLVEDVHPLLHTTDRMADLLALKKTSQSRVAVGFIGGAEQTGPANVPGQSAAPSDCRAAGTPGEAPVFECSCLADSTDLRWCEYTQISNEPELPGCQALAGSRYIDFADAFSRHTFDTICKAGTGAGGFGESLAAFTRIAIDACFDLDPGVAPARNDPAFIQVQRDPVADADIGFSSLPMVARGSSEVGWYYMAPVDGDESTRGQICLNNLDRLLGDVYDVFVLTESRER